MTDGFDFDMLGQLASSELDGIDWKKEYARLHREFRELARRHDGLRMASKKCTDIAQADVTVHVQVNHHGIVQYRAWVSGDKDFTPWFDGLEVLVYYVEETYGRRNGKYLEE